jgi:GDPmannose 4,6-dehydratase
MSSKSIMQKKALIIGITGQDGAFLAKYLLDHNYLVYGTSRDAELSKFDALVKLGIHNKVKLFSMSLIDFRSVFQVFLEIQPDEVYNLAGQTSVSLSFKLPVETLESISLGTLNILEVMRLLKFNSKFYNASSSECFGNTAGIPANELTPFKPRSPYGVAKSSSFWQVDNYRQAYNLFAASGILFNHESYLRPTRFVTQKIITSVCDIAKKKINELEIGNINIERDWGWAPEYVVAMHSILQQEEPEDYIIATGNTISLKDFIIKAFDYFGLNYENYLVVNEGLFRPTDIIISKADPTKAKNKLKWEAKTNVDGVIKNMIEYNLKESKN